MTTEERIAQRIAELRAEMDKFVIQTNQQITAYQAAIGELERLIKPDEPVIK